MPHASRTSIGRTIFVHISFRNTKASKYITPASPIQGSTAGSPSNCSNNRNPWSSSAGALAQVVFVGCGDVLEATARVGALLGDLAVVVVGCLEHTMPNCNNTLGATCFDTYKLSLGPAAVCLVHV